ncbi:hypothetical protein VNI00_003755 [Paramarasmius palmivorus]|uniref:Uncharacterized protein n=1 Tax=Paramarasmius palmivorus TaxID=297713 RepID=A0AAW0DTT3_9AGAR
MYMVYLIGILLFIYSPVQSITLDFRSVQDNNATATIQFRLQRKDTDPVIDVIRLATTTADGGELVINHFLTLGSTQGETFEQKVSNEGLRGSVFQKHRRLRDSTQTIVSPLVDLPPDVEAIAEGDQETPNADPFRVPTPSQIGDSVRHSEIDATRPVSDQHTFIDTGVSKPTSLHVDTSPSAKTAQFTHDLSSDAHHVRTQPRGIEGLEQTLRPREWNTSMYSVATTDPPPSYRSG